MNVKFPLLLSLMFALTSCTKATFYPDVLPDACLNQFYSTKVYISGGLVVSDDGYSYGTISDKNFNLTRRLGRPQVNPAEFEKKYGKLPSYDANELMISGTPTSLEPIDVKINVAFYKHMFSFFEPSNGYKKTYTIYVRQCS